MRNIRSRAVDVKKDLLNVMNRQCVLSKKLVSRGGWSAIIEETFCIYNGSTKRIKRWKHEKEKTYAVQHHFPHHGVCDGGADDGKRSGECCQSR